MTFSIEGRLPDESVALQDVLRERDELLNKLSSLLMTGYGTPEGAIPASVGTIYLRRDGSTSTTIYIKTSGTGDTGWTAK